MLESQEEADRPSLVDLARSVINNPVNFGYRIRDLCSLMTEYLNAKEKEVRARQAMKSRHVDPIALAALERARRQLYETLSTEIRTLKEVASLARKKSRDIEFFLMKLYLPAWEKKLGRDPFGTILFALEAVDNAAIKSPQVEHFKDCGNSLSLEVEDYIQELKVSASEEGTSNDRSASNKDGKITQRRVQQVLEGIQRYKEDATNKGQEPTRTVLRNLLRDWGCPMSTGVFTEICNQLFDEGKYHQRQRKPRRRRLT